MWRRRAKGRKRKTDAPRYPSGQVRPEPITPTPEMIARRIAAFGNAKTAGDPTWIVDVLWGQGRLDDRERAAAIRFNAIMRGFARRAGAPDLRGMRFHDAGGPVSAPGDRADAAALDAEAAAALEALKPLGATALHATVQAVCYDRLDGAAPASEPTDEQRRLQALDWLSKEQFERLEARRAAKEAHHYNRERLKLAQAADERLMHPQRVALVRMGLQALAAHFAHGQVKRLARGGLVLTAEGTR